jgi:hypothetical protein
MFAAGDCVTLLKAVLNAIELGSTAAARLAGQMGGRDDGIEATK